MAKDVVANESRTKVARRNADSTICMLVGSTPTSKSTIYIRMHIIVRRIQDTKFWVL